MIFKMRVTAVDNANIGFKPQQDVKLQSVASLGNPAVTLYIESVPYGMFQKDQELTIELQDQNEEMK